MQKISLNGDWRLTYTTLGKKEEAWGRWIPAVVPGDIHLDLMRAGLICEPLIGMNSTRYRWIEEKDWWYRRKFTVEDSFIGKKMELVCDGLDLTADIWLNGEKVGSANNMFRQHRYGVTHLLKTGLNELLVRLDVGFEAVKGVPTEKFAKAWGRAEPRRPWMRKAQQAFYWDVAPRLVTCGIWRDIYIESSSYAILRDVHVTSSMKESAARVNVEVEVESLEDAHQDCWIEVRIRDNELDKTELFPVGINKGLNQSRVSLLLDHPKLWWPNGMGDPHLYEISIKLLNSSQQLCLGEKVLKHGIRTITVAQEPLNEKEKTFTVTVNGCKVFCKGGDWVPSDAIYARINREHEFQLLKYAQEANFNMIRVWGGGVYPDPFFYDICDELGIMVWQDFMYACGYYPDDEPAFCEEARLEAEWIVRKFRNHASLAIWCGNNENYWMHNRVNPDGIFYGFKIYDQILPEVIQRLDGVTYYHPSSPYPGTPRDQESQGNQHVWSYTLGWYVLNSKSRPWDYPDEQKADVMRVWDIAEKNYKFVSEYGLWRPSNPASLQKYMGEYPAVTSGEVYEHHRNYYEADFILEMLRRYYKRRDAYSAEEFIIAGQMLQAEVVKHVTEELRSRMYVCSGVLFWEYNDTWGHVGYAPVDYYLNVYPLYFYMQRAYAPLHVVFKAAGSQVWLLNETLESRKVKVEYGYKAFTGESGVKQSQVVDIAPCSAQLVDRIDLGQDVDRQATFVFAEVYDENGQRIDRNRAFLVPLQDLKMPEDTMSYQIIQLTPQTWQVSVSAKQFVWMVKIDADENLRCSDNAFDLWPGESRTITVSVDKADPYLELRIDNINRFLMKE